MEALCSSAGVRGVKLRIGCVSENQAVFIEVDLFNIGWGQSQRRYDKKTKIPSEALDEIDPYIALVREFLEFNRERLNEPLTDEELHLGFDLEEKIN